MNTIDFSSLLRDNQFKALAKIEYYFNFFYAYQAFFIKNKDFIKIVYLYTWAEN